MKWFKKTRFMYSPDTWQGNVVYLIGIIFLVTVFVAIDRDSHSVSDTIYGIFPYFASTFLLIDWLASKTSSK